MLFVGAVLAAGGLMRPAGAAGPDGGADRAAAPRSTKGPTTGPATAPADALPAAVETALTRLADPSVIFINELDKVIPDLTPDQRQAIAGRLREALKAPQFEVRRRAALALGRTGDMGGVPALIEGLSAADNARDRDNAAVALRILRDPRAVPALAKAVDDPSPHVRLIALEALGEMGAKEAFDRITARLTDKAHDGRSDVVMYPAWGACYALGELGDPRAAPLLTKAAEDPELRHAAEQALRRLNEQQAKDQPKANK